MSLERNIVKEVICLIVISKYSKNVRSALQLFVHIKVGISVIHSALIDYNEKIFVIHNDNYLLGKYMAPLTDSSGLHAMRVILL